MSDKQRCDYEATVKRVLTGESASLKRLGVLVAPSVVRMRAVARLPWWRRWTRYVTRRELAMATHDCVRQYLNQYPRP